MPIGKPMRPMSHSPLGWNARRVHGTHAPTWCLPRTIATQSRIGNSTRVHPVAKPAPNTPYSGSPHSPRINTQSKIALNTLAINAT